MTQIWAKPNATFFNLKRVIKRSSAVVNFYNKRNNKFFAFLK